MNIKLKNTLQHLVITTSNSPLKHIYRLIYSISIKTAVTKFRNIPGVTSIYLRRGVASGDIVYGLSDIDLLVLMDDGQKQNKQTVSDSYDRLATFIPLFGQREKEFGIYTISEFKFLFNTYGFYTYRFIEGKQQWKLLYGKDVVKSLNPVEEIEIFLSALEEFKTWWTYISCEFLTESNITLFNRKYNWYKIIAEAAKIYLLICQNKQYLSRKEALGEIKQFLPPELQDRLAHLREYRDNLTEKTPIPQDELVGLFIWLLKNSIEEINSKVQLKTTIKAVMNLPIVENSEIFHKELKNITVSFLNEFKPYFNNITVVPRIEFNADGLNNSDIDSFIMAFEADKLMPLSILINLVRDLKQRCNYQNIEPFLVLERKLALSLYPSPFQMNIKTPVTDPIIFDLIDNYNNHLSDNDSSIVLETVYSNLPISILKRLKTRNDEIGRIIYEPNIYKLNNKDFCRFFWSAARTRLLISSDLTKNVHVPLTSDQISDQLKNSFPEKAAWLDAFSLEYYKELSVKESNIHFFLKDAIDFLLIINERGTKNND
jgi:predicted nucleotidyltransferase